jgi:hypothetical protein
MKIVHYNQLIKVKGPSSVPMDEIPEVIVKAEQQPRKSGRVRQRPERLGGDTRDPNMLWIP